MNKDIIKLVARLIARTLLLKLGKFGTPAVVALTFLIEKLLSALIGNTLLSAEIVFNNYLDDKHLDEYKKVRAEYLDNLNTDRRLEYEKRVIESARVLLDFGSLYDGNDTQRDGVHTN